MSLAGKEIQEKLTNFGTCKFHFNRHLVLLYLKAGECLYFLELFGSIESIALSLKIATEPPTFPPRNAYKLDKHELNVVKLLIRRKAPCFTLICLDAPNNCRYAGLLYQRGESIAMAREHNA